MRKRRMDLGLLQREVAAEIGVHVETLALWERGRSRPDDPPVARDHPVRRLRPRGGTRNLCRAAPERTPPAGLLASATQPGPGPRVQHDLQVEHGKLPRNVRSWQKLEPMFKALDIGLEIHRALWPKRYRE
ncbi:MAG: helix-turn-helix domain-containing protein [Thermoanaerobaculia bacterium]